MTKMNIRGAWRHGLWSALGVAVALVSSEARAAELIYYEDWHDNEAFNGQRWVSTGGCATYARDDQAPPPGAQSRLQDPPECSGRHVSETIGWSGGRLMSRNTPIPVAAGNRMCVTAWIRAEPGAKPTLGLNYVSSANEMGFPPEQGSVGGCHNGEHWLMGTDGFNDNSFRTLACGSTNDDQCCGRSTTGYNVTTQITTDGEWRYYTKSFTVQGNDVNVPVPNPANPNATPGTYNRLILKLQNWSGGGGGSCDNPPVVGAKPRADFDDIRVYKLGVGEECPTRAEALAGGDDAHTSCAGDAPFCLSRNVPVDVAGQQRQVPQTYCAGCTKSYGDAGDTACGAAAPGCDANTGACGLCNGDHGTAATRPCGADHPVCNLDGTCGACADAGACDNAPNITRAGPNCVAGACTNTCTVAADGTSDECGANRYCMTGAEAGCRAKLANGSDIPARADDGPASGLCRNGPEAPVTATIFCASGVCSADNKCGLRDEDACTLATAAQCRAGRCGNDDKCGLTRGEVCTASTQCRGDVECTEGFCGGPSAQCAQDADCGTVNFACDSSGVCVTGCRGEGGNGCPAGKACTSQDNSIGNCIDDVSSSSSSGGSSGGSGTITSSSSGGNGGSSSGENNTSSGGSSSGGSSGDAPNGEGDGAGGGGGCDCSTSESSSGSLVTMMLGMGMVVSMMRRRRRDHA